MLFHRSPDTERRPRGYLGKRGGGRPVGELSHRYFFGLVLDQAPEVVQRTGRAGIDGYVR